MPKINPSDPEHRSPAQAADLADRFIDHVEAWLTRNDRIFPMVMLDWPEDHPQLALRRDDERRREHIKADFLHDGRLLAVSLSRLGFDASGLLRLLNAATGDDAGRAGDVWPEVKVSLQLAIIQLRNAQAGETGLIDRLALSPTPPRDAEQANTSELLQLSAQLTQLLKSYHRRQRGLEETVQLAGDVLLRALESGLLGDAAHFTLRAGIERARDGKLPHQHGFAPGTMAGGRRSPQPATHAFIYAVRWLARERGTELGDFFPDGGPAYIQQGMPLLIDLFERIVKEARGRGTREPAPRRATETDWRDVQRRLLEMCDKDKPYTNLRDLMKQTECRSTSTVSKAIKRSTTLIAWKARYAKAKSSPRAIGLNEVVMDNIEQTREPDPSQAADQDYDDNEFRRLIEDARTPEDRARLNAMSNAERRKIVALRRAQRLDHEPSPLEDDPPDERPKKVKEYKRV
ncbi:MAG: hypothetical protein IH889_07125 [Planctomycetes bacterium]|nr:hypothetical protein [Planctomycetota bacterium]